jgi:ParB family chromosome partitioning protein
LTAHKTAALQSELMKHRRVTLALLAAQAVSEFSHGMPLQIRFESQAHRVENLARGYEQTSSADALAKADAVWDNRIPAEAEPFEWFLSQPESVSLEAIVWATARTFTIIHGRACHDTKVLEKAMDFDLTKHFHATVDTYLGQVSKGTIIENVKEACGAQAVVGLDTMKKDALAAAAQGKLATVAWVPELIR